MTDERPRVTLEQIERDAEVHAFIVMADQNLERLGYTEHSVRHAGAVAGVAQQILRDLGHDPRQVELAGIAGYLHDIGNAISRLDHGIAAALLAREVLLREGMSIDDVVEVMAAIGNHEEEYGEPISEMAAALILADKADVDRSRVRNPNPSTGDIHDRVNLAARQAAIEVDRPGRTITLALTIDTTVSQVMGYFEIFLSRMEMCRRAANFLGCDFGLVINGTKLM